MKIVHVIQYFMPKIGYQETFLARRQMEQGHDVTVVTSDRYEPHPNYDNLFRPLLGERIVGPGRQEEEGIDTWRLRTMEIIRYPICTEIGKVIDQLDPDVVHVHLIAHFLALPVVRRKFAGARFRLVVDEHGISETMNRSFFHRLYRKIFKIFFSGWYSQAAQAVVGITKNSCQYARDSFGIDESRIGFIPLGSEHRLFQFTAQGRKRLREKLSIAEDARVVLFTGKNIRSKRADALIAAMPRVMRDIPDAQLVLVGRPDMQYLEEMKQLAKTAQVMERIHFCDAVPAVELPEWFSMADLACWPAEVTISLVDAASCSLPTLAPRSSGVEYQISGDNGEMIEDPSLSPEKLGAQIVKLLGDPRRLKQMGENGRRLVEKSLSWEAVNEAFMRLYNGEPPHGYGSDENT